VNVPDPVDARLLALIAEVGRVAVPDLADRAGLDVREVAARLAGLAAGGLPLVVGVECDPTALRYLLSVGGQYQAGPYGAGHPGPGAAPNRGWPGPPTPMSYRGSPPVAPAPPADGDPASAWGPSGSAAWARGDDLVATTVRTTPTRRRIGVVGDPLHGEGPDGEQLVIRLVELIDPADHLFTAAGYQLQPGERSVLVHTEVTNHGTAPLPAPPDLGLALLDGHGRAVFKAPVQLSSRPPHRLGVKPGATAGGHTVYVLPEATELTAVRWSARPDDERGSLTWTVRAAERT